MTAEEEVAEVLARAKAEEDVARVLGGGQESPEDEVARVLAASPTAEPTPEAGRPIGSPEPLPTGVPSLDVGTRRADAEMGERTRAGIKAAASKIAEIGAPMGAAALANMLTGGLQIPGALVGGMAYRGARHMMTPTPQPDPNLPDWAPRPSPGPSLAEEVLNPREMAGDVMLGAAPGIGAKIGANFPAAVSSSPLVRKIVGGAVSGGVGAASELTSENPSVFGALLRAVPSAGMGYSGTGTKILGSDVIHDYGRAPTLDEAVTGTLDARTPMVSSVEGPRNKVGGAIEKLSSKVRGVIERTIPGSTEKASALMRQGIPVLADSGDPNALDIASRIAELEGTQNRAKTLFHDANAGLSSQFSKDELNQATLLRYLMEQGNMPMTAPAWLQGRERDAFDYIGELNDALARAQEGAGVRMPVTVPLEGQAPGLGSIPFQRRPNYGIPTYDASLVDPNQTPLQRALVHEQSATVRSKPIPDLPPDFRQSMTPGQLTSLFQRAARRVRSIGSQGLTQTTQQTRGNVANPLLDFDEIYRIKIDRDAHHVAMARAFPGELRQMDLGDGRSLVIGESGEQMLLKLKESNPHLFNLATDMLHELTVPNLSSGAKWAQGVSGFLSRGYLGRADISNMNQRTTTDWMLGRDVAQEARAKWKADPDFRRAARYGTAAGGTPRIATDMETRSLSGQLMQQEEGRLRGYESSGAILGAEKLSARLAQKQAAGLPFSRRDEIEAKEFGASASWLASRNGKLSTQEAGQVLHDWTTLTQGSFEPGRMAEIFTNPFSRVLATQWRGFSASQAALVKRHIWDLMMDADKDVQRLGLERATRFLQYQVPQSAKVAILKSAMSGKLAIMLKHEEERAKRDGVPLPELWGAMGREVLQGGLGFIGDTALLAAKAGGSLVHGTTGVDLGLRGSRDDVLQFLRNPGVEAIGGTLGDVVYGDTGDRAKGIARLVAMSKHAPNLGPYAPMVGNLGEAAYDSVAKGE